MQLGTIQGEVDTKSFTFRATEEVKKFDFVSVKSNGKWILSQVEEVTKEASGETYAEASIIGYRDKGMTRAPRRVIEPDSIVYTADQDLISETLGLKEDGLEVGNLETDDEIDIFVDPQDFYKHFAVLAQTGAGKSYTVGVLIEEMLEQEFPVVVIDPHGEYSSLGSENPERDDSKSYEVTEYSPNTDINKSAIPLKFSSKNFSKKELKTLIPDSLTNSQMGVLYNALKDLKDMDEEYNLEDIQEEVSKQDSTAKWNLLNYLEQLEESDLFSDEAMDPRDLVEPGEASIVNLKAVDPDAAEMAVYLLAKKLFNLRKRDQVPPFIMVFEEAHNYIPEKGFGQAVSNPIMRKIASEGRKFGLGIGVISQRPARIDKNVLSQCNTQFVLKVTNPNDLKALSKSFEGMTSEVEKMIKSLPPGVCFALGNQYPVMTDVRQRKTRHGGETETADSYEKKTEITFFRPEVSVSDIESRTGEKHERTFYPLYIVESDESRRLVDGTDGSIKAEVGVPDETEQEVLMKLDQGLRKPDIVEETDLEIPGLNSVLESLRSKNILQEDSLERRESILEVDKVSENVPESQVQGYEVGESSVSGLEDSVSKVYYPYLRSDSSTHDPVLDQSL